MSTSAPVVRTVDQLPAMPLPHRRPSKLWDALEAADERNAEFERQAAVIHGLRGELAAAESRLDEVAEGGGLEQMNRELGDQLLAANSEVARLQRLLAECRGAAS